jgi:comEA protein
LIWKFQFSRKTLIWILGIAFLSGIGYRTAQQVWYASPILPMGVVTGTPEAKELRLRADSIMLVRDQQAKAPININTATAIELERLDGIGPVLAKRIVDYRDANGPFGALEELMDVSGIGPKKLERMRERCVIGGE